MGTWTAYTCGSCGHDAGRLLEGGGDLCGRTVTRCADCDLLVSVVYEVADAPDEEGDTPQLAVLRGLIGQCPRCHGTNLEAPASTGRIRHKLSCPRCGDPLLRTAAGHWA